MAALNASNTTYLIKFHGAGSMSRFIVQDGEDMMNVLKKNDFTGIESIKVFDPVKGRFKRYKRANILKHYNWNTEVYLYLKDHYYFK